MPPRSLLVAAALALLPSAALASVILPLDTLPGALPAPWSSVATASDEAGGDDVPVCTFSDLEDEGGISMDIAENGDIYVATTLHTAVGDRFFLWRSQDHGDTWLVIGSWNDADPMIHFNWPVVHVAEGNVNRVYVAYQRRDNTLDDRDIWVAWTDASGDGEVWTDIKVMDQPGIKFEFPDLSSDAEVNGAFRLFLVATAIEATTSDDLWFASSTDFGATWNPEYLFWTSESFDHWNAKVRYGKGGIVHFVWESIFRGGSRPATVTYRRAYDYGATYADFADTTWYLTTGGDRYREFDPHIAVSHSSDNVVVTYTKTDSLTGVLQPARVLVSSTAGFSWTDTGQHLGMPQTTTASVALPGTLGFRSTGASTQYGFGVQSASDAEPKVWSPMTFLSDKAYFTAGMLSDVCIDYSAAKGNQVGILWRTFHPGSEPDTVFFDAEWRADPGYPNLEPGFPMALPADPISPPAICELDGDMQGEIVYGDALGFIRAYNHDGTVLPGWPVDIGLIAADSPMCVGDLDGDGRNEVVCGDTNGNVHAFRRDGAVLPGFPVAVGSAAPCYAAIGAILPGSNRQVAAVAGTKQTLLLADGSVAPGWPVTKADTLRASPAIGDVDHDGDREIVIAFGQVVEVTTGSGAVQASRNLTQRGKTFSNAPTLGDLNLDLDLEIVVPTDQGDVYVLNPDGSDLSGWPYTDPQGSRITSVAIANIRAGLEPELGFAVEETFPGWVHARYWDNTELSGFPDSTHAFWPQTGAPIFDVLDEGSGDLVMATGDDLAWAWGNFGSELPGWPKNFATNSHSKVSPASGDVDQDGELEVVFTLSSPPRLVVVDVGADVQRQPSRRKWYWPMYGYNPQRTGCHACDPDAIIGIDDPQVSRLEFAPPSPNPASGAISFRFVLPAAGAARLTLYDVAGRRVRELVKQEMPVGSHAATWDGTTDSGARAAAGVYYARLTYAGATIEDSQVRRITIVR